uniref:Transcription cofactor vestigial-like protein 4 n=1 Tax=Timema poppense TaxID=170557 RepID=A0A7R9DK41_TIMPO|nr:unnamed protein product [Timema poppensis]
METSESPLDVLSRAATMVQDNSPPDYEETTRCELKHLPSARWRQERRCRDRLGECNNKSRRTTTPDYACGPLDMSTRSHCLGPPPSYSESLMSSTYRPSVIACAPPQSQVDGGNARKRQRQQQSGGGVSDPVIDEHFRRSLGKDYTALFSSDTSSDLNKNNNKDSVAHIGLSVDDHFAKALGETWVKLQSSQSKEKKGKLASPSKTPSAAPASTNKAALVTPRRGLLST